MGSSPFHRIGLAGGVFTHSHKSKRASNSCSAGGFYKAPITGQSYDSLQPLTISWDPSCLKSKEIDIYLLAPSLATPRLHLWQDILLSDGTFNATLMPRWWNSTSTMNLQITIVESGNPPYLTTLPAGPVFKATYTAPSSGTPDSADTTKTDSGVTTVNNLSGAVTSQSHMSSGKIAAAVIVPLLFAILCVFGYLRFQRMKGKEKRKRWSEAVDKRMSTISSDWKSMTPSGAQAAIRNSMAVSNRNSAIGVTRPRSTASVLVDGGHAGVGAKMYLHENSNISNGTLASIPSAQLRPGLRQSAYSSAERASRVSFAADTRVSRVSFADTPRPSMDSIRRTRAFHNSPVPPLPTRPDSSSSDADQSYGTMSPTQTHGALTLSPEAIRARLAMAGGSATGNTAGHGTGFGHAHKASFSTTGRSVSMGLDGDVLPALSMMHHMNEADRAASQYDYDQNGQYVDLPALPTPTHSKAGPDIICPATPTLFSATSPIFDSFGGNTPAYQSFGSISPAPTVASDGHGSQPSSTGVTSTMGGGYMPQSPAVTGTAASMMSPDEMLRAYAERNANKGGRSLTGSPAGAKSPPPSSFAAPSISYPVPTANSSNMANRISILPAAPGAYSPATGAYGTYEMYGAEQNDAYGGYGMAE